MKILRRSKDKAPRAYRLRKKNAAPKGLIMVHTGNGKGKSTAAFGTALRALGHGMNVAVVQFIKGNWKTGEAGAAKKFGSAFRFYAMGEGFTWNTKDYGRDVLAAARAWEKCKELLHDKRHGLVIFDEINYALKYNFLDLGAVLRELKRKPPLKHVILTGNGAPKKLIQAADLVTEMKAVKHPFDKGILAKAGIDY
ncbi:MAG TPA: cob(I)yrinic acid a,c-diamide adenosyltransferase [Verrucomicrobiae bacterium]|nr:cob(I)yrinic acid a,c-diamide adenosyltransferase [Verrucomicrobiae bacterium]